MDIQNSAKGDGLSLDTMLMIAIGTLSLVVAGTAVMILLGQDNLTWFQSWELPLVGCILTIAGIGGMFYCRRQLGHFWTAETVLHQDHHVIDQGVHGIVRHPIYTFAIVMYIGLGIVFATWWNILSVGGIVLAYMLKARDEELFLARSLSGYQDYQTRVRYRLFPGLW